jgi:hypothetical protein
MSWQTKFDIPLTIIGLLLLTTSVGDVRITKYIHMFCPFSSNIYAESMYAARSAADRDDSDTSFLFFHQFRLSRRICYGHCR